ncbi:MAG TPA: DedA family protein [Mycobacteriales bacterium]|nr:DedA family protein [Mycobacteriales bacterium]
MSVAPPLPGVFRSLAPILDHYGYLAVGGLLFLEDFGVPVPGETALVAAAVYAGAGRLNVVAVGGLGLVAAILGDNVGYTIGHFAGRAAVLRWGRHVRLTEPRLQRAEAFYARHGGKVVTIARFVEGLRQTNGIIAGITGMRWRRFVAFDAVGAALWVGLWTTLGYTAGSNLDVIYRTVSRSLLYVLAAVALLIVGYVARRRHHRAAARRRRPSPR